MFRLPSLFTFVLLMFGAALSAPAAPVAVLANSDDPDSLKVARHYVVARGLSEESIVALPMPLTEQISWAEFVTSIHRPLQEELVRRGWIDAINMDLKDEAGRRKIAVNHVQLAALVVCRGVPLKIANDKQLAESLQQTSNGAGQFKTTAAAVDSELALLALADQPVTGFVPNPVFGLLDPSAARRANIIPVGRLDGPTAEHACALVDNAIKAEREGLVGRAYIDIGGPHKQGDGWLREAAGELTKLGFAPDIDTERAILSPSARFDAPVFYFGWYNGSIKGPMSDPDFRFPPGAIALHIHSFSAANMRNGNGPWTPALVARGVTLTVGNVYEPYLQFTHQPQRFIAALASGLPAGQAALVSVNALSWQAVLVGDPLYRPFTVSLEQQWERLAELPAHQTSYLYLRKIRMLESQGQAVQAKSLLWTALRKSPSLPVVLALARRQIDTKDRRGARQTLAIIGGQSRWRVEDAPLVAAGARLLVEADDAVGAVKWYKRLLDDDRVPGAVHKSLLKEALETARAAMDFAQATRWEAELNPPAQ